MAQKIAVLSQKGGTGKTTAVRHARPTSSAQPGSTSSPSTSTRRATCRTTSTSTPRPTPTVGDVLAGRAKAAAAAHDGIIPANLALAEAELAMAGKMGRELILRKALKDVDADHDVILIDCPPRSAC